MRSRLVQRATVKMVIQASILHVIVEEEVADGRHGIATKSHQVSVLDVAQGPQLILKFVNVLGELIVQLLDSNWMTVLQATSVHLAGASSSDHVLLAEILCQSHHLFIGLRSHTQVEYHKTWWTWKTTHSVPYQQPAAGGTFI